MPKRDPQTSHTDRTYPMQPYAGKKPTSFSHRENVSKAAISQKETYKLFAQSENIQSSHIPGRDPQASRTERAYPKQPYPRNGTTSFSQRENIPEAPIVSQNRTVIPADQSPQQVLTFPKRSNRGQIPSRFKEFVM